MTDVCRFDFSAALDCSLPRRCSAANARCKSERRFSDQRNHLL